MKFETIIFDMDGVVIDSERLFDRANAKLFSQYGKIYKREEVATIISGMSFAAGTAVLKEKYNFPCDIKNLIRERQTLIEKEYASNLQYIKGFEIFLIESLALV